MLGIHGKVLSGSPKRQILTVLVQNWKKLASKQFLRKTCYLTSWIVHFSKTFLITKIIFYFQVGKKKQNNNNNKELKAT